MEPNRFDLKARQDDVPIAVSHGMGVNSTAAICLMVEWGIKPRLVQFADTGGEKPATYDFIPIMDAFLAQHGMPPVTIVRRKHKYATLEASCLGTDTLPGLAFGRKSCSKAWKIDPMNDAVAGWRPRLMAFYAGHKMVKVIGYDFGERDSARFAHAVGKRDSWCDYWYLLREAKADRDACKRIIKNAGLPVPIKSACFFCPAAKLNEVRDLKRDHPDLLDRALTMEVNAVQGKHGLATTRGLGRRWSWLERLAKISVKFEAAHEAELQVYRDHAGRRYSDAEDAKS